VIAFIGKNNVRTKIVIHEAVTEQIPHIKYLGCDIILELDKDMNNKLHTFQVTSGCIRY
jgi:ferritin-like protein